ncbi:44117_t:CDS:2, partial [Gigaspora margarita]
MSTGIGALDDEEAILHKFVNWTSGNAFIDNLIQQCQLENPVPAIWVNGWIDDWNNETQKFKRSGPSEIVLKRLFNSDNPNHNFFEEAINHVLFSTKGGFGVKCYGITKDPNSDEYILILEYMRGGDFNALLSKENVSFDLKNLPAPKNLDEYIQSGSDSLLILQHIDSGNNLSKNNE